MPATHQKNYQFFRQRIPGSLRRRRSCGQKIKHPTIATAEVHAEELNRRDDSAGTYVSYQCFYCNAWHVGRRSSFIQAGRRPEHADMALYFELGDRAYFCGVYESWGSERHRLEVIRKRLRKAVPKS